MQATNNHTFPFVTVIIPTFRDWHRLGLCLQALTRQTYPQDRFEIIVANNDPADQPHAGFTLPANAIKIDVAKPGSYAARNRALERAKGTIIGFTDSDCIPAPNWIGNAVQYLQNHPECCRVAGNIKIYTRSQKATPSELYNSLYAFRQEEHVRNTGTSVTANLFTYRNVFDQYGYFDEKQLSLGDLLWGKMVYAKGCTIRYVSDVVVEHPARSFQELVVKEKRVGGGQGIREREGASFKKYFFKMLKSYFPRRGDVGFILIKTKGMSPVEKLKVLAMRHYLLHVRTKEHVRVALGKEPNRA